MSRGGHTCGVADRRKFATLVGTGSAAGSREGLTRLIPWPRPSSATRRTRRSPPADSAWEFLDSEVFVTPAPSPLHQFAAQEALAFLRSSLGAFGDDAIAFVSPIDVILNEAEIVQPDERRECRAAEQGSGTPARSGTASAIWRPPDTGRVTRDAWWLDHRISQQREPRRVPRYLNSLAPKAR
jgi:hypothetical protein